MRRIQTGVQVRGMRETHRSYFKSCSNPNTPHTPINTRLHKALRGMTHPQHSPTILLIFSLNISLIIPIIKSLRRTPFVTPHKQERTQ